VAVAVTVGGHDVRLMVARRGDVNGGGSGSRAPTHRILGHAGSRAASDVTWHT
jgi:hypothetical protein